MNIIKKYIIMALVAMTSISFAAEPVEHEQQEATQEQLGNGLFFDLFLPCSK